MTALPAEQFAPPRYFDVNVDGAITANDVLLMVNVLSQPEAEGESSQPAGELATWFSPLNTPLDDERASSPVPLVQIRRDPALAAVDAALVPGTEWVLPQTEAELPHSLAAAKTPLDDPDLFDLDDILEDVAAEIAAPGR